ncbi:MAG: FmdB family zinc ribbon protein [Fimbriimonadaceae bacterium]
MPIYEYRCQKCGVRFSLLEGVSATDPERVCARCGSTEVSRLISRVRRGRSEDQRLDEIADKIDQFGEPEDPGELRKFVREMGKAMDDDASDELEEMLEADIADTQPEEES